MAAYVEGKPEIVAVSGSEFHRAGKSVPHPEIRAARSDMASSATAAYIVAAIVLITGAFLLYLNYSGPTTTVPAVIQDSTMLPVPAPNATAPAFPVPAAPSALDTTPPPAIGAAQQPVAPAL